MRTNLTAWPLIWWRKKTLFCFLGFTILSHFIILTSCSSTLCHWLFRLTMVRALTEENERVPWIQITRQERQTSSTSQLKRLYTRSMLAFEGNRIWHCASYSKQTNKHKIHVSRMEVAHVKKLYHAKLHFWGQTDIKLEMQYKEAC